ncbi:MAG: type II secretion system F family protein, partial [Candidatus Hydrogenedentes bacterium]|nr:type II secretion system F family protein [Candidatus Hydrogenedentota bacterium]
MAMKGDKVVRASRASASKKAGASRRVSARATFDLDEAVATETAPAARSFTASFSGVNLGRAVGGRVRDSDVNDFLRQLIMLLEAGTPLLRSLTILSQRGERAAVRNMVADITQYVENGNALWQAFERWPRTFMPVEINLIKAAEASGNLNVILKRMVGFRERRHMLTKRIKGAMWYPVILVITCVAVLFLIAKVVVPQFTDLFDRLDIPQDKIPALTKFVMHGSQVLTSLPVIAGIVGLLIFIPLAYVFAVRNFPTMRYAMDHIKLRLPRIGKSIARKSAVVDMTRSMALLLRSGLSMMTTLDLVRANVRNTAVAAVIGQVRDSVERGEGIEEPLRRASGIIPPVVTDMLVTGEDSGQLDQIAEHIAETYEEEVNITIGTIGELIQPILTVFLGVVVLVLFVSLFLPILTTINELMNQTSGAG